MTSVSSRRTLITGASQPLGLELVRQSLLRGDTVYAASRNPARVPPLAELRSHYAGLELLALDPADASSVADAVPVLQALTDSLDMLIIAPAEPGQYDRPERLARDERFVTLSGTGLVEHCRRHVVAPLLLVRTLLPWLAHGDAQARILIVTGVGRSSPAHDGSTGYASSLSSGALQSVVQSLAEDLRRDGIVVCLGNVDGYDESSGDHEESLSLPEAARGVLVQAERLQRERSGSRIDWTGVERV